MDDLDRLRRRQDEADDAAARHVGLDDSGAPCLVGKTATVTTYPTTAGRFFAVTPHDVTGTESEGSTGTVTATAGRFYALHIGTTIPPVGTTVVCVHLAHRWAFQY